MIDERLKSYVKEERARYALHIEMYPDKDFTFNAVPISFMRSEFEDSFVYHLYCDSLEEMKVKGDAALEVLRNNLDAKPICKDIILNFLSPIDWDKGQEDRHILGGNYGGTTLRYYAFPGKKSLIIPVNNEELEKISKWIADHPGCTMEDVKKAMINNL